MTDEKFSTLTDHRLGAGMLLGVGGGLLVESLLALAQRVLEAADEAAPRPVAV